MRCQATPTLKRYAAASVAAAERTKSLADAALLLRWDRPVSGREKQAIALFGAVIEYYRALQKDEVIESFEPVLLAPSGASINGFILIRGEAERLDALRRDERFLHFVARGEHVCAGFGVIDASIGEELEKRMIRYATIVSQSRPCCAKNRGAGFKWLE